MAGRENRRTIWILNHYAISPDMPGGTRHYDLGRELVKRGYEVIIFASGFDHVTHRYAKIGPGEGFRVEDYDGVRFVWLETLPYQRNDWRRVLNMFSYSFKICCYHKRFNKPGVIIGSSPHPFAPLAAWWAARRYRVPFWLELRDLWPQALVDMEGFSEWHPGIRFMRMLEQFLYARADKIIILAQGSMKYLRNKGVPDDKVAFIPNGVRLTDFPESLVKLNDRKEREEARKKFDMKGFTVVYTGAHGPANALETILDTARILAEKKLPGTAGLDVNFLLVGDGPEKGRLVEKAQAMKLKNVRFMAPVPKKEIPSLLLAADAAVITLRNVAAFHSAVSPNKLFDYLAAGKPVLAAVPGDAAAMVAEAEAGLAVPPENPEALASAVLKLTALPEGELRAMGQRGRRLVEEHYCREKLAVKLAALLEKTLKI